MHRIGRALADPTRSQILLELLDGPAYPGDLADRLGLTRSNVSNHLTCLRDCGIVVAQLDGRRTLYDISDPHLRNALTALVDVTLQIDEGKSCIDDKCQVDEGCGGGC